MVGATGFEPATPSPPCWCATGLRHAPTSIFVSRRNLTMLMNYLDARVEVVHWHRRQITIDCWLFLLWWAMGDSNARPLAPEANALSNWANCPRFKKKQTLFFYLFFFLCLSFLRRFFLLCVAILWRFRFLPHGKLNSFLFFTFLKKL